MSASVLIGLAVVALLAVLVGYTVPTLVQLRKTASALEQFLHDVTPRVEAATSNLESVLGRMDRIMQGMEDGTRGITGAMGHVGSFLSHLRPPAVSGGGFSNWLAAASAMLSGLWQAWSVFTAPSPARAGKASGGSKDE